MKHSRSFAVVLASGLFVASAANAQDMYKSGVGGVYTGLNYTFMSLDAGGDDADVGTLSAKAGVMATPFLGFEARGGFGVDDDRVRGIDYSVDNFFGGYATFNIVNESPVTPYAVLGFTRVEVEAEGPFNTVTDDDSDVSYGVGLNMEFARNVSGNLEYMRYYDDDDVTVDGLGVGVQFNF
ncbi:MULTISPECIES: outer membrane beta-barrel protein [Marinobacter]|jgi:outer membrane immunogenic protein|uniref:outer membrane beta-barrel protein n=1 Tax=Marinobacter TaxID=2742 RepID=UPI0011087CEB|nr:MULTISPECIES: outer membrane beta-barrel protein [Marinobacter]MCK2147593.1 porin family protein [Marinobacter alexandrii]